MNWQIILEAAAALKALCRVYVAELQGIKVYK